MPTQETITNEKVGALVRAARERRGMTQKALAEKIGVSEQSIQHYEKGRAGLTAPQLGNVAQALGVRARDLLP